MKKIYYLFFALALIAITGNTTLSQTQNDSLVFTTSGTFPVPAGVTSVTIEVVGAGGSGRGGP